MAARLWTTGKKIVGNLLPVALALPFAGLGVWRAVQDQAVTGMSLLWAAMAVATLWLGVNFLGLYRNEFMKRTLLLRLKASVYDCPADPFFVGFARPAYRSVLDPHEDIGYVLLYPDRIEFFGEMDRISLAKSTLSGVRLRPNPHSWALLGGWVSVEGTLEGAPVRMLLEPRERRTLWGNRALRKALKARIERWMGERPLPQEAQ